MSTATGSAEKNVSKILTESCLSLRQASAEIESVTGIKVDRSTIFRWVTKGCGGVKLDSIRLGQRILVSREAINRFIVARS